MSFFFCLQDALILYARFQLNLTKGGDDGNSLVDQLLDVVCKDLDQSNISSTGVPWWVCFFFGLSVAGWFWWGSDWWLIFSCRNDATKDDKFGTLNSSQYRLVELAAVVFYRVVIPHYLYLIPTFSFVTQKVLWFTSIYLYCGASWWS